MYISHVIALISCICWMGYNKENSSENSKKRGAKLGFVCKDKILTCSSRAFNPHALMIRNKWHGLFNSISFI